MTALLKRNKWILVCLILFFPNWVMALQIQGCFDGTHVYVNYNPQNPPTYTDPNTGAIVPRIVYVGPQYPTRFLNGTFCVVSVDGPPNSCYIDFVLNNSQSRYGTLTTINTDINTCPLDDYIYLMLFMGFGAIVFYKSGFRLKIQT